MKILKRGRLTKKGKRFDCNVCGCAFVAEQSEYKFEGSQRDWAYVAKCPCCNNKAWTCSEDFIIFEEIEL